MDTSEKFLFTFLLGGVILIMTTVLSYHCNDYYTRKNAFEKGYVQKVVYTNNGVTYVIWTKLGICDAEVSESK
jgi:hypothetical protein